MSVFGGDSWARGAQHRKRRAEDLIGEGLDASSYKKLSNGKFACLLCPNNPILDSSLMLSMHRKGSRHQAAESRLKERELQRQYEIRKRIALSDVSIGSAETSTSAGQFRSASIPLIEQTKKAASEILCNKVHKQNATTQRCNAKETRDVSSNRPSNGNDNSFFTAMEAGGQAVAKLQSDFQSIRERDLRFTAAGWKRDCHGKWFKDENAEFDSDEEDPNICLASAYSMGQRGLDGGPDMGL